MIGELLQLSRENDELRKEIDALKAEVEALTKIADAAFEFIRTRDHDAMVILKLYADKRQALLAAKDEG